MRSDLLFCDDIRIEASGQHTLVGVYQEGIVAASLPVVGRFSCWLRVYDLAAGPHTLDFSLSAKTPTGELVGNVGEIDILDANSPVALPLGPFVISVEEAGTLDAILSIDGQDPVVIGSLKVSVVDDGLEDEVDEIAPGGNN